MTAGTSETVRQFWRLMATNDFQSVAEVLSPDFVVLQMPMGCIQIVAQARKTSRYDKHSLCIVRYDKSIRVPFVNRIKINADAINPISWQIAILIVIISQHVLMNSKKE